MRPICTTLIAAGWLLLAAAAGQAYEVVEEKPQPGVVLPATSQHFRSSQCHYTRDHTRVSSINCGKPVNSGPYKKDESYVTFGKGLCTLSPQQGQVICSKLLFKSGRSILKPHHLPG